MSETDAVLTELLRRLALDFSPIAHWSREGRCLLVSFAAPVYAYELGSIANGIERIRKAVEAQFGDGTCPMLQAGYVGADQVVIGRLTPHPQAIGLSSGAYGEVAGTFTESRGYEANPWVEEPYATELAGKFFWEVRNAEVPTGA